MLMSTALVMLMTPALALFYGGMVRSKNVLATMMHSFVALAIVGVYWFAVGYSFAFGPSWLHCPQGSLLGWSNNLFFLWGIKADQVLPGTHIPVFLHAMYQGMFAIITPALISGALAERHSFSNLLPIPRFVDDLRLLSAGPLGLGDGCLGAHWPG